MDWRIGEREGGRVRGCLESRGTRHCEQSEAICSGKRDCFVASGSSQ